MFLIGRAVCIFCQNSGFNKNGLILDKEEVIKGVELKQPFSIQSACVAPKYTNYTAGFADCLDYVFYQADSLEVKEVRVIDILTLGIILYIFFCYNYAKHRGTFISYSYSFGGIPVRSYCISSRLEMEM